MAILPSFKRRPSAASSPAPGAEGFSPSLRASVDGEAGPSSGRRAGEPSSSVVMVAFDLLNAKLPSNPKPATQSAALDAKIARGTRTFVSLAANDTASVVEPLVYRLLDLAKASEYQTQDSTLSRSLQTQILILDIFAAILPKPPSHPGELPPSATLPIDGATLTLLLEALSNLVSERTIPHPSPAPRGSEDSGRGSLNGRSANKKQPHHQQHHIQRHQNTSSRSGPFSPMSSSNSLPQDSHTFASGSSSLRNGEAGSSEWGPTRSSTAPAAGTASGLDALVRKRAGELIRSISYFRWDVVWASIRGKLQGLASESLDDSGLSETCLESCFIDRTRLVQVLSELSPVFIHLPRPTQTTVAEALYQAIWTWIRYSPADFVDLHRKGIRLEGDPSSLFDVCFNVVGDASATGGKKVHSLWSVMTLLIALCPDLIRKVLEANPQKQMSVTSSMGKKINFVDALQNAYYSTKLANAAKRSCLDLVELANLLPKDVEHNGLLIWVSDFAGDLYDQLLNGKDTPDADLITKGLVLFHAREPTSLMRALPRLETGGPFDRMCLAQACTALAKSSQPIEQELFTSVSSILGEFVTSLKSTSRTVMDSSNPTTWLRDLRQSEIDLVLAILELYTTDVRFLIPPSATERVGPVLNLLSCMVNEPMNESVRSAATEMFESLCRQSRIADEEGSPLPPDALASLATTTWRTAGNAAYQVLHNGSDDPCQAADLAVLVRTFTLSCEFAASHHPESLATMMSIREAFGMHEVALTFALLSPDDDLLAAAPAAFLQRDTDLTKLLASFGGEPRSPAEFEVVDAQCIWHKDTVALFPSGRADSVIDQATLDRVLSSHPAITRAHQYVFKSLFSKWETYLPHIRTGAISASSSEFAEWLHLGAVLSRMGQPCYSIVDLRDGPCHPDLPTLELLDDFIQGLCDCLIQQQPLLRAAVANELSLFGPGLIETLIPSLVTTSRVIFRRLPTPTLQDLGTVFASQALDILLAVVPNLSSSTSADPGPLLMSLVQRLDRNMATLAGIADPTTLVDGVAIAIGSLQPACQLCELLVSKRDLFEWENISLLRCELLDRLSNWTTYNLTLDSALLPSVFAELNRTVISAAVVLTDGLKLQSGYRVGGSRKRLFETWFTLLHHHLLESLSLQTHVRNGKASSPTRFSSDLSTAIANALSNLLSNNGDVAFDRCIAMTFDKDLAVRAVYIRIVGDSTRRLTVKEKRTRSDLERFPLLDILVEPGMLLLPILTEIYARVDHDTVSELVLRRFENEGAGFPLLQALVEIEVAQTTNESEIFRGTTLCTKVYSQFARHHAKNYLRNLLRPFVQGIIDDNQAYGSAAASTGQAHNPAAIESLAQTLLDRMCASLPRVPYHLRAACRILGETVNARFPGLSRRAVGSFIILRIMSPSVISPAWMELDLDGLSSSGRRALVDVSKLITNLANDVVLGQKDSHMHDFHAFRSQANIHAMENFLDGLQAPDTSAAPPPTAGPASNADEDDSDELFLRFMLREHAEAVDQYLGNHPRREEVKKLFVPVGGQQETAMEFMTRTRARRIRVEEFGKIFREVKSSGKVIFCLDCGRLEGVDLDRLMRYALDVLQDASSVGYTIILDFTSLLSLEGISVPWLLDALKIFDTLKTLWEGGASRCKRVVAYGVNSWAVLLYQRVSSLLALSNGTRVLRESVGVNSRAALAALLEIDEEKLSFLTAVPTEEDAIFFDPAAEFLDNLRNRTATAITLGRDAITLSRPTTRLILGPTGGGTHVHDVRPLSDLRDISISDDSGCQTLRLRFRTGDPLELITERASELQMMIPAMLSVPAPRSRSAAPEMTAVRLTLSALLNLVALKGDVRETALAVLRSVVDAGPLRFPPLPSLQGLAHPRTAHTTILKFTNDLTLLNPEYSIALIREGCLVFGLVEDAFQRRLLLDFFHAWVWNLSGLVGSVPPKTDPSKLAVVLRDLLAITLAHHGSLRSELSEIWAKVATFEVIMADAAGNEVIAKAAFAEPSSERIEVVAEVALSIVSHSFVGNFFNFVLQLVEGSPSAVPEHAWRKQLASLAVVTEKLTHLPRYLEMFLPELLHVSLLTLWTVADSHLPLIHNAILNVLQALAPPSSEFSTAFDNLKASLGQDQRCRNQSAPAETLTPKEVIDEAISKEQIASYTLSAMLHSAKNRDQANIWRTRWLSLATTTTLKSSVATRPASLAVLKALVEDCPTDASGLYCHVLDSFGRTLTDHSDDEAGVVAMLRFLSGVVDQLPSVSLCAAFWIGIAVVQISPAHFAAGLDLVGGSLRVLLSQRCYPTPNEFVRCLVPEGNFFLSHVDADWGVNLEDSFVFSVLAILYQGLQSPSTLAQTTDTLFSLLEVLLQSRSLDTAEELAIVLALASSSSANLTRIEALCARLGLPPMWEELPLEPETHVTMLFVAFVAGPVLASGTEKTEAFQLLARAAEETPRALEPSHDLLLPQLSKAIAKSDNEDVLAAADTLLAHLLSTSTQSRKSALSAAQNLEGRGLSSLLTCHVSHHPIKIEHFRRLLVVASEVVRVEVCRLETDGASAEGSF